MTKLAIIAPAGVVVERQATDEPPRDWVAMPGSLEAIGRLNQHGIRVVLAFNEPGLGSGRLTPKALNGRHRRFCTGLARGGAHLDGIVFCPHAADSECPCRLPEAGLFVDLLRRFSLEAGDAVVIAQDEEALAAGGALGCRLMRISAEPVAPVDEAAWPDLAEAVGALLEHSGSGRP
jgi:D-glycero-D-manno-heptose 1,7-bisphosphate phosphatase